MIAVHDLTVRYPGQACHALSNMALEAQPGERVLLAGATGCGKSTLGLALCGAIPEIVPARRTGAIRICNRSIDGRPVRDMARDVGFLMQNVANQIFSDRVDEEVAFGLENFGTPAQAMEDRIQQALELVDGCHLRGRLIDTLSAGERQRVALAALLAVDPQVLVLDEPLAFLDSNAASRLLWTLERLSRSQKTVLVFEHRRDMLRPAVDREVSMAAGYAIQAPPPALVFSPIVRGTSGDPALVFDSVDFAWPGRAQNLLRGISFAVRRGESVVLLGDNGSGKTTILALAMGLLRPKNGRIQNCGLAARKNPPGRLAEKAALLFQNPDHQLHLPRVGDEVRLASAKPEPARQALSSMGLADLADRHPRSLSMGQKRRLTLAAALCRQPELMLLDEPSVGQDDRSLASILEQLGNYIQAGGALLTATHDRRVADALSHRCLVIKHGQLHEAGKPHCSLE